MEMKVIWEISDEMNERQRQANGDRRETGGRALVGRSKDYDEEEHRQHDFRNQRRKQWVAAWRVLAVTVRGKTTREIEPGLAAGDQVKDGGGNDRGDDLGDPIWDDVGGRKSATGPQTDRNRRVEMTARYVPHGVGHGQNRQSEGERYADESNTEFGKAGGENGAAASAEHQPKGPDELCAEPLCEGQDQPSPYVL